MKKYIGIILILLYCGTLHAQKATTKTGTNPINNNLQNFIRLYYKRTDVDSLVALCGFPFYSKGFYSNTTWRSAKQMKQELQDILMRSRFRQTNYTVQSLHQIKKKANPLIKNKNYSCFQMLVHLPEIGDGENGTSITTTFYVANKKPYRVIGVVQQDE